MTKAKTTFTLDDITEELRRRERVDPLAEVYRPGNEKHLQIHQSRKGLMVVYGANRAGKTTALIVEALLYCLGRKTYAEVPHGPVTVWYVVPSMTMWERVVYPVFLKWCPQGQIHSFVQRPSCVVTFSNGSTLHFVSADMKQRRLQGGTVHLVIMDETPDKRAFAELQARVMSTKGRVILGFAPVESDSNWVRDELYIPWTAGDRVDLDVVIIPIADKDTGESLVPWFTKADIDRFKRQWPDPAIQAARLYGEPMLRAGNVLWMYDPETHIIPAFEIPVEWTRWCACDPEYYRFMILWFAVDPVGNYYVTDELFSQQENLRQRVERAQAITELRGPVPERKKLPVYTDSANQQEIAELNWHFAHTGTKLAAIQLPAGKDIIGQTSRVQAMMEPLEDHAFPTSPHQPTPKPEDRVYGAPRLFFFDSLFSRWTLDGISMTCSRLLWEIGSWQWGKDNKPDDRSADGADGCAALRYGCSVLQHTAAKQDPNAWKRDLPPQDVMLWNIIERERSRRRSFAFRGDY
jgi:phage terminase large subunit-like protein